MIAAKLTFVLTLAGCHAPPALPAQDSDWALLTIQRRDNSALQYRAYPENAAKWLFPRGEALVEENESPPKWNAVSSPILDKIQVFKISDMRHRFTVDVAAFGEQLFIFDNLFCDENASAMKELLLASNSAPRNRAEALELTKLYLALSYYSLEDQSRYVAYRADNNRQKSSSQKTGKFSDMIGILHSPQVTRTRGAYLVDLYAYDQPGNVVGKVSRWQFKIDKANFEETMSAHHEGFRKMYTDERNSNTNSESHVQFSVAMMANGSTEDGAETDIQYWAASDGPGVQRIHFYYRSHEKAEARMQDFLKNAVAIIDTGPWLQTNHALVVRANEDAKTLFASELFQDEASVLELSCTCLRNLLGTQRGLNAAKQH
jgi:hypothetical protein